MQRELIAIGLALLVGCGVAFYLDVFERVELPRMDSASKSASETSGPAAVKPSPAAARVYALGTLAAQNNARASLPGDLRYDAELIAFRAEELCNELAGTGFSSFQDLAVGKQRALDPLSKKSYAIVDTYRARYCGAQRDIRKPAEPDIVALAAITAANNGGAGARAIADAISAIESPAPFDEAKVRADLEHVVRATESPGLMTRAIKLLSTDKVGGFGPPGFEAGRLDDDERFLISIFGSQLAACRTFGSCDRPTAYSVRMCLPDSCRGAGSINEYIEGRMSPTQLDAARRYADSLIAMRNGSL